MDSSPTDLYLPNSFPYPIKLVSLDVLPKSDVHRGTRLLSYSFVYLPTTPDPKPETRFGTWDSAIEGAVHSWKVKPGDVISAKKARERPVIVVIEPCKHGMQIGGLCVICGKDMTNVDYTGFSDASRASIQMTHSAFGPTVSLEEAQRIERETADHLLKSRKLSLIVDLDQTIVHATVDPTVGEWITEGEAWEARQAKKSSTTPRDSDDSDESDPDTDEDECNPNWEALKDVKRFRLGPESFGPPSIRGVNKGKGKHQLVETEGCMYYIKPRPGWQDFLREMATKYEMHVYTMGTRAYAEEVCTAIDPDGRVFGGRILSRDESGSLTQKNLQRLFPCDTSMVVIIDDRADVWEWSPNLVKVIPYDFFVGIGDINSTFLPKIEPLALSPTPQPEPSQVVEATNGPESSDASSTAVSTSGDDTPLTTQEAEVEELQTTVMVTRNNAALDAQLEERPLAKKQEELQEHEKQEHEHQQTEHPIEPVASDVKEPSPVPEKLPKKALLKNDDIELERIGKLLSTVHSQFFGAHDARSPEHPRRKTGPSSRSYDVTRIIPKLRSEVFDGVHVLFSSVIPLDTKPESTEIWRMAHMFGARCSTELTSDITHVVAAKRGTVKVDMARKRGGIKIVWLAWFTDSIALWRRQEEKPYLLDDPPMPLQSSSSPVTGASDAGGGDGHNSISLSSDLDVDSDEWDQEPAGETKEPGTLALDDINWDDINDEVEAAMNESDDDEYEVRSERGGVRSEFVSEDEEMTIGSANNTPTLKRKRLRSVTPSDGGVNGLKDDHLRSPLAKRKKVAAERTGYSRLKEGISAEELQGSETGSVNGSPAASPKAVMQDEMDDEEEEEEEEEDDFLARELEEEWG